jgi:chemotaxis protein MotA
MIVIIGLVVVMGAVLTGFTMAGGNVGALIHPSELVTIGGAALGALIVMSPKKVLKDIVNGVLQCIKGTPYGKAAYEELFKALYELFRLARRDGLMALESQLSDPQQSPILSKYPRIANNHHVMEFICGAMSSILDGTVKPEQLSTMLASDLKLLEEEQHGPVLVMTKTADSLPGFGIVAAVMGIVITMGAIDGPVEEIGHKVGAALVGTFLGILMCYGIFAPLATQMEFLAEAELSFFRTIATAIEGFVGEIAPKVALEQARRKVGGGVRFTREELDELFKQVDKG